MKALGPASWGLSMALIDAHRAGARAGGAGVRRPVSVRRQRARASSARWCRAGRRWAAPRSSCSALAARSASASRATIAREPRTGAAAPATLVISRYAPDPAIEGKSLAADRRGTIGTPPVDLVVALLERGDGGLVSFNMSEPDIAHIMRQPWTMTCTDGDLVALGRGQAAPARLRRLRAQARRLRRASAGSSGSRMRFAR